MSLLVKRAHTVWLVLGVDKIVGRLAHSQNRPLVRDLAGGALRKATSTKLKYRRPFYKQAEVHVQAWQSPEKVADRILKKLNK